MDKDYNFFDNITIYTDIEGNIIEVDDSYLKIINKKISDIIGKKETDFLEISSKSQNCQYKKFLNTENSTLIEEEQINYPFGLRYYKSKKELLTQNQQQIIQITRRDITEYKQYINMYHSESKILGYIAKGKKIEFILDEIIKSVESKNSKMVCSILLLDESKKRLIKCAAPSIPEYFSDKINGMEIGEKVGSCGAAVFLKKRVIVEDISTHENWKSAKYLAAKFDLHACWSQPIFSSENEILGSFAIYYKTIKKPSKFDIDLIENVANITGVAIEKHINNEKLKRERKEKKQQEELLLHKSKQAMMGEMLENIAHQWRQPLSVISTYATGIMMKKEHGMCTKDLEKDAFEAINLNAQYLSNTIENFRKFFLSNSEKVNFFVEDSIDYTLKLVEARFKNLNIKLINEIDSSEIYNYRNELTQVFMNIFNNSADALEDVDIDSRYIQVRSYKEINRVKIIIIDSANGAKSDIIPKLFEPYFTTKEENYGTGIGLFMCYEIIVKHMKGTITAKNSSFKLDDKSFTGLEFTISLPIELED
ncbi:MAG: ATP-binding protein [Halarcobacter sp.]